MIISYRYPIFPSREVEQKLVEALDTCRWLYNRLLVPLHSKLTRFSKSFTALSL